MALNMKIIIILLILELKNILPRFNRKQLERSVITQIYDNSRTIHTFAPKKNWVWVSYPKPKKFGYETQTKTIFFFSFYELFNVFSFQIYYFEMNS